MPHPEFIEHCLELLQPFGSARAQRMFGGHGLYLDGLFVAIVASERLYLKLDDRTRPAFEAAGGEPFTYQADGQQRRLHYATVPEEALESAAQMQPWLRLALEAALRARAAKAPSTRRKPAATPPAQAASSVSARAAAPSSGSRKAPSKRS